MKDHSFKFKSIRRVEVSKPSGGIRKLGIPGLRDRFVQKVIAMAFEEVYESIFLNSSHGFSPRRRTHFALKSVTCWTQTRWLIEGDISKCCDILDYHILEQLLKKEIFSKLFIDLYWKAVKSHYINLVNKVEELSSVEVLQGEVFSPIFSNIYLHKLDKFMQIKAEKFKKSGPTSIDNLEYKQVYSKILNMRQYFLSSYRRNCSFTQRKEIFRLEKFGVNIHLKSQVQGNRRIIFGMQTLV